MIGCEDRLRNDLYCVGWGVKLYSNQKYRKSIVTLALSYDDCKTVVRYFVNRAAALYKYDIFTDNNIVCLRLSRLGSIIRQTPVVHQRSTHIVTLATGDEIRRAAASVHHTTHGHLPPPGHMPPKKPPQTSAPQDRVGVGFDGRCPEANVLRSRSSILYTEKSR